MSKENAELEANESSLQARVDALTAASNAIMTDEDSITQSFQSIHDSTETHTSITLWKRRHDALSSLYLELKPTTKREER
jgi:hypothetical protein